MKRAHRRAHASIWPILVLAMLGIVAAAVAVREHPSPPARAEAR